MDADSDKGFFYFNTLNTIVGYGPNRFSSVSDVSYFQILDSTLDDLKREVEHVPEQRVFKYNILKALYKTFVSGYAKGAIELANEKGNSDLTKIIIKSLDKNLDALEDEALHDAATFILKNDDIEPF